MFKHVIVVLFLLGIKDGRSSAQEQKESKEISKNGIKKNVIGANGLENTKSEELLRNFRNPVLEYLLLKNSENQSGFSRGGIIREIRHSQTLILPGFSRFSQILKNPFPDFDPKKPVETATKNPRYSPVDDFWNYLKNKSEAAGNKSHEAIVTSPVLHLSKNPGESKEDLTRIQIYPAVGLLINTFNKDGTLKNSLSHFQPDFNSITRNTDVKEAIHMGGANNQNPQYILNNYVRIPQKQQPGPFQGPLSWPFANYFPIVINDPFLSVYNAFATSMYNAVTSVVEYGPEADICDKAKESGSISPFESSVERDKQERGDEKMVTKEKHNYLGGDHLDRLQKKEETEENFFDEVTIRTQIFKRSNKTELKKEVEVEDHHRTQRDATSIFMKTREGDVIDISLEEPFNRTQTNQKNSEGSDLTLRKGGIAIVGPGGAATAYTGGIAIVGPYGTVYKSPEGMAILGPFSKVVNITDDTSFEEVLKMHKEMLERKNQRAAESGQQPTTRRFQNYQNLFSYKTDLPIKIEVKPKARNIVKKRPNIVRLKADDIVKTIEEFRKGGFKRIVQSTPHEEETVTKNKTTLIFRPKSKAEAGRDGIALSAPTSHAILYPGQKANIYFEPESVASAGPSGFAHAHSDLFVSYLNENKTLIAPNRRKRNLTLFLRSLNNRKRNDALPSSLDARARSFSSLLVNTPPLSTILRPPNQGYVDKRRKAKPSKPIKEEGSSEEVGEENEEETTNPEVESANEGVAISPPPEGASIAEAKPIGLAIAGPGGVAASKPQGTAVAGPGGLAIARPVGTAIAGVDVEGSVPIGGQQKNKKKPKQEQEKTEDELHYVGGLTGPIGNPQPKEFADGFNYKALREADGNNIQDNMYFSGRHSTNGFQLKLGQQDGKYGFIPMFESPVQGTSRLQKRGDSSTYFHGLLGNNAQANDQILNYQLNY